MDKEILKELRELNKTMNSIREFIIAETQLSKSILSELQKHGREIKLIKEKLEVKNDKYWWCRFRRGKK